MLPDNREIWQVKQATAQRAEYQTKRWSRARASQGLIAGGHGVGISKHFADVTARALTAVATSNR